jgi:hypothetical protein
MYYLDKFHQNKIKYLPHYTHTKWLEMQKLCGNFGLLQIWSLIFILFFCSLIFFILFLNPSSQLSYIRTTPTWIHWKAEFDKDSSKEFLGLTR